MSRITRSVVLAVGSALLTAAISCGRAQAPPPPPTSAAAASKAAPSASASGSSSVAATPAFNEAEFTESESSRDPFHNFGRQFIPNAETRQLPQYEVLLEKYAVDELKLVAIVSAGDGPRAMFVDPQGKGWVVQRGAHLGRGENVKIATGVITTYPLYWKVDRIKPTEVVLVREDTLHPEVQPVYREIPLHVEAEKT